MGSKIVQARSIRGNDVVLASTAAELLTLLAFYQGTSNVDPNYLIGVTIQLLPIDYTFTQAQLPLLVRTGMALRGTGQRQTRLISAQTTNVAAKPIVSCLLPYGGRAYNVTLAGFTIVGDAYATAGIYAKGLESSTIEQIQITGMTATNAIGVQIDAEVGFGVYYNTIQSVEVGVGVGSGATIGFRLKTIDFPAQPRRANSNNLMMCSAKYSIDAGYEINGTVGITITSCEAEGCGGVGLRLLNATNTVVSGGYFETNTTADIQLGEISGAATVSAQTCLLQPYLGSTTRLTGLSQGASGDFYLLSNSSSPPLPTSYDRNWLEKAHIKSLSIGYAEFREYSAAVRVGYYRLSGDANYRLEMLNDGTIKWGGGSTATDVVMSRHTANVLQLADTHNFRLNSTGALFWASGSGAAPDVIMSRMSADILGLSNNDSFQLNNAGALLWASASATAADVGLARDGAAGTIAARLLTQAHSFRIYNTWTSSTIYERAVIDWITTANTCRIGTEKAGTGTARNLALITDATVRMTIGATTGDVTFTGTVITPAATTSIPSIRVPHGTAPTSPTNGDIWTTTVSMYARINGSTVDLAAGTGVATDVIWDAAGDLAVGTGANTAAKLVIGTALQVLRVNAGATALEWSTAAGTGDMILASAQTVTVAKTFNDTTFLLRNVANTFNGSFVNTNTANRIYTLPDVTDTLVTLTSTQTLTNKTLTTPVLGVASATTVNKVTITAPTTSATLTLIDGSSLITAGAFAVTLTSTALTNVTLPTTGTLATLAGTEALTNKTITATAKATYGAIVKVPIDYTPAAAGTATLDCSLGDTHRITMPAGNITIALTNITNGQMIQVAITQPSVGSRLVTWFNTIKWANRTTPPVLTVTALKRDVFGIMCTGSGTYDGYIIGQNI